MNTAPLGHHWHQVPVISSASTCLLTAGTTTVNDFDLELLLKSKSTKLLGFDTENLIELLLNNKLTLSTKESSLINDIKKIIMYYDLNKKLKNTKNNVNKIKI